MVQDLAAPWWKEAKSLENDPQLFFFFSLGLLNVVKLGLKTPETWEEGHEQILCSRQWA